jgi:adenosyl cobinamide kinase/adenosyl cobinamide phosphate guanylyltransferase
MEDIGGEMTSLESCAGGGLPEHWTVIEARKKHEMTIRKDEREKVLDLLDDLRKYANGEYNEAELSDNEHDLRIHLEYENRIWGIMKERRQSKDGE